MSGYSTYNQWKRIEEFADKLGFRIGNPRSGGWGNSGDTDTVAIFPKGEELPVFSRDAEIFCGTFNQLSAFLSGWERAHAYDNILRLSDDKKRKKYEDKERARQAEVRKREEQKKMLAVLKATDAENRTKK